MSENVLCCDCCAVFSLIEVFLVLFSSFVGNGAFSELSIVVFYWGFIRSFRYTDRIWIFHLDCKMQGNFVKSQFLRNNDLKRDFNASFESNQENCRGRNSYNLFTNMRYNPIEIQNSTRMCDIIQTKSKILQKNPRKSDRN